MDSTQLLTFILTSFVIILAPGPDLLYAISTGVRESRITTFYTCLGFALGNIFHLFLFLVGVGFFLKSNPQYIQYIKLIGCGYLILIGIISIKNSFEKMKHLDIQSQKKAKKEYFYKALMMNILNPKVILFFMAFFPQFIRKGPTDELTQLIILGSIFIFMVFILFFSLSITFSSMGLKILYRSKIKQYFDLSVGVLFIGIGLKLFLSS